MKERNNILLKSHISNKITFISNLFSLHFKQLYSLLKSSLFCIYHQVNHNLNVNIITLSDPKIINGRKKKLEEYEKLKSKEKKKEFINQFIFFFS